MCGLFSHIQVMHQQDDEGHLLIFTTLVCFWHYFDSFESSLAYFHGQVIQYLEITSKSETVKPRMVLNVPQSAYHFFSLFYN